MASHLPTHLFLDDFLGLYLGTVCSNVIFPNKRYHTGTLHLGVFNGPTEGILSVVGMYIITYFLGNTLLTLFFSHFPKAMTFGHKQMLLVFRLIFLSLLAQCLQ